jgi:hypothetical protein
MAMGTSDCCVRIRRPGNALTTCLGALGDSTIDCEMTLAAAHGGDDNLVLTFVKME